MHELGLCDAMLKTIRHVLAEEKVETGEVRRIVPEIGELSGVVPRFMEESWKAVIDRTPYADVALEIQMLPGYADCLDCSAHFRPTENDFQCPVCGGTKLKPVSGTDMMIQSIEVGETEVEKTE